MPQNTRTRITFLRPLGALERTVVELTLLGLTGSGEHGAAWAYRGGFTASYTVTTPLEHVQSAFEPGWAAQSLDTWRADLERRWQDNRAAQLHVDAYRHAARLLDPPRNQLTFRIQGNV